MTETDVAIIGAGISGLVAAHSLRAAGCGVLVLERQVRPGGNAISERIGGFLMEHGRGCRVESHGQRSRTQ
jgi:phytoene dehydrogenase-like protein